MPKQTILFNTDGVELISQEHLYISLSVNVTVELSVNVKNHLQQKG